MHSRKFAMILDADPDDKKLNEIFEYVKTKVE